MTGTIDPDIQEPPARPRPASRPRRRRTRLVRRGWRLWVVLAVTTALSIIAVALGVVAWDTIENSKLGRTIEREGRTADFELPETPAQFLVAAGNQDVFLGAVVMSVSTRGAGGWAFLVPPTAEVPDVSGGTAPIAEIYERDGVEGADVSLERLFGADLDQGTVVGPSDWRSFLGGPVEVSFPFRVEAPDENGTLSELYPSGPATVQPDDVPYLLQLLLDGEAESNRLERQLAFWQGAVASMQSRSEGAPSTSTTSTTAVVPGVATTVSPPEPFSSFVSRLVAGEVVVKRIPGRLNGTWPGGEEKYDPEEIELGVDVAQAMPGAVSPLELAPRVWLVNTTGRRDVLLEAAGLLFVLGFNLVMASDDPDGPVDTTELHWWGPDEQRAVAEHVREGLEFGVIVQDDDVVEGLDMAIHLGSDWAERLDAIAAASTTTTTTARSTTTTVRSSGSGGTTPRPSPATTSGTTVAPTSTDVPTSTTDGEQPTESTTPDPSVTTVPSTSVTATSVSPTTSSGDAPATSSPPT